MVVFLSADVVSVLLVVALVAVEEFLKKNFKKYGQKCKHTIILQNKIL